MARGGGIGYSLLPTPSSPFRSRSFRLQKLNVCDVAQRTLLCYQARCVSVGKLQRIFVDFSPHLKLQRLATTLAASFPKVSHKVVSTNARNVIDFSI